MNTITFDTLDLTHKLREAGFDERQAEAVVRVMADSQTALVTRDYLDLALEKNLSPIKAEQLVVKWMIGALIALSIANFAKQFF